MSVCFLRNESFLLIDGISGNKRQLLLLIGIILQGWKPSLYYEGCEGRSEWNKERPCQTEENCNNGKDFNVFAQ